VHRHSLFFTTFLGFALLTICVPFLQAGQVSKEEVLAKYEKAISLTEEYHVYQEDVFHILPKVKLASQALLKNDLEQADRVLTEAFSDFEALKATKDRGLKTNFKLEWLEIYLDVIQHYAILALLAYFFVQWGFFKAMLKKDRLSIFGKVLLSALTIFFSVLSAIFDLSRYGESAWIFFDVQLVLIVASGLLGGFGVGISSGMGALIFRWLLKPALSPYLLIVLVAGLLGGLFHKKLTSIQSSAKLGFFSGFLVGLLHGAIVYLPLRAYLEVQYLVFSISFLAILEGCGVALLTGVIGGILREEARRDIQNELLKTKLLFLQAQLRPHFFFNALNTISAICGRENALQAQQLLFRLSDFLRHTLKREDETVTFREEMAFIDSYLEIEKARFQERLKICKEIHLDDKAWDVKIPLLVLQPLVENAIGHGIRKKEEGGTLWIKASERQGMLHIEIADDGVGVSDPSFFDRMLKGEKTAVEGLGIGVRNIYQRLMRFFAGAAKLSFKTEAGVGTSAIIDIPLNKGGQK